jgi:nitrite reductase/ring-hydroxylating ferredoxin subunit
MSNEEQASGENLSRELSQGTHAPGAGERGSRDHSSVVSRRWLLFKAGIALNGLVGLVLAVPILRFLFAPWRKDSSYDSWVSLGEADTFPASETRLAFYKNPFRNPWDGQTDDIACYVRHIGSNQFQVFAINCAHLDCPVRWFPQSQLFMCPCHGGVYYADGSRASGPPPRGLFTYNWKIESGELLIDAGQMPTLSNTAKLIQISIGQGDCSCRG